MSIREKLTKLTKAQALLLSKAAKGPLVPYNAEWVTFYKLRRLGLMAYETTSGAGAFKRVKLTDAEPAGLIEERASR